MARRLWDRTGFPTSSIRSNAPEKSRRPNWLATAWKARGTKGFCVRAASATDSFRWTGWSSISERWGADVRADGNIPESRHLSIRKLQLPLDRLEARLLAQRIQERVGLQVHEPGVTQAHR